MSTSSSTPHPLGILATQVGNEPGIDAIAGQRDAVLAVPEVARATVLAALINNTTRRPIVIATPTGTMAQSIAEDLAAFLGSDAIEFFPSWETLPFERVSPAVLTMGSRMRTMWRMRQGKNAPTVIVAGTRALLQKLAPGTTVLDPIHIAVGNTLNIDALCEQLVHCGYRRETIVEHRGEFARRGAIVDIFPSTDDEPIRVDMWGDDVDRLTHFTVADQRSTDDIPSIEIFPARELLYVNGVQERARELIAAEPWGREQWERLSEGQIFDGMESWLPWLTESDDLLTDHLGDDALVIMVEPRRMSERARDLLAEEDDLAKALATSWARDETVSFPRLHVEADRIFSTSNRTPTISVIPTAESVDGPTVPASGWGPIVHDPASFVRRINEMLSEKWSIVITAETPESIPRLVDMMRGHGIDFTATDDPKKIATSGAWVTLAPQTRGASLPNSRIAIISEADLSGRRRTRSSRHTQARSSGTVFEDLQPGGYVVHAHHGVGKYEGMVKRSIGGVERDYLLIAYKGGDKLYVPTEQIGVIRQYVGGEAPTLHRMGGSDFARAKSRVRSAVREVAQELVLLYQRRVSAVGHAFPPDTPWQSEMENAFPFIETPDQLDAIAAIKTDMESEVPMDRLLCGDVGFGKTEIAVRATFKAIQDGKQVAVLVPTTLLATQHGNTFSERFAGYPIKVEVLSRFLTNAEAKKVIAGLKSGEIDCVIGTHRLLQDSIEFKNLGLLIVDEEQRFGVQHKEAMKRMKTNVDVLSMSATPIPRTLEMSLVGIRDLSLLQTPPADRQPILTFVGEQSEQVAIEAIRRELLREGQVFWVHNRVLSIEERAAQIREWVPEARVAVAHGQMDEASLEQIVLDFWEGNFDVLVCTTIIESGIDMPTVNTLVVERADLLGLGQMHQLRGRVGRSGHRAYAYLFHPRDKVLSHEAYERLRTIGESTDLGSGFKIAMRDLEIRGAGNLLGESQSGHIAAVGYDLYCQLVTEAVSEMKGESVVEVAEIKVDITMDAHLPNDYVPSQDLRLEAYRRLATVRTSEELADIETEWRDRFGSLPEPAQSLISVGALRVECLRLGITEIVTNGNTIRISPLKLRASQTMTLRRLASVAVYKEEPGFISLPVPRGINPAVTVIALLQGLFDPLDD
ncbi:MAG: transcription-repair coupling factor [Ilumatobacteraceae bacterium]|nr:transcription-repair coupling factor [Ilumatobacteraceae bacterium]